MFDQGCQLPIISPYSVIIESCACSHYMQGTKTT